MYLNDVKLIGNLGGDAEVKTANNQNEYVILSVAVNESWKNKESGAYDTRTDWPRVVVWGKMINFAKTLKKGERILVTGKLRTREYDKEIGKDKSKTDVTMSLKFMRPGCNVWIPSPKTLQSTRQENRTAKPFRISTSRVGRRYAALFSACPDVLHRNHETFPAPR